MPSLEELLRKSIPELNELFVQRRRAVPKGLLEALDVDTRQGAHQLAKRIRERYRSNRSAGPQSGHGCSPRRGVRDARRW